MSFWDIIWFIIVSFAFIAYLMVMFNILADVFRDHEMSGFLKAVWIFFLIFLPFVTALVYMIARGQGMAQRQTVAMLRRQDAQDAYIKTVAGSTSASDEIAQAKTLFDAGSITRTEYDTLKAKALA